MSVSTIKDIPQGSMITFRSLNPNDLTTWIGTLESIGTYVSVRGYGDQTAYNEAVRQINPSVSSDITTLTYFLITVDNSATVPTIQVFADEWISPGTLSIINPTNTLVVTVKDPFNNPQNILSLLSSGGYAATIGT